MPRGEVHQSWGMLQDAPNKASMTCPGTLGGVLHPLELIVPQARHTGSSGKRFPRPLWADGASLHRFLLPYRMCLSLFCERRLETLPPSMKSIFANRFMERSMKRCCYQQEKNQKKLETKIEKRKERAKALVSQSAEVAIKAFLNYSNIW